MKHLLASFLVICASSAGSAEVDTSDFVYSSDLAVRGFLPFAVSGTGNASYGMMKGTEIYLCFIADTSEAQAERQRVLRAEIAGENTTRTVPNIPVACILTQ